MGTYFQQYKYYLIVLLVGLLIGGFVGFNRGYNYGYDKGYSQGYESAKTTEDAKASVQETKKTEIVYIPKKTYITTEGKKVTENTDIEATIPKTDLHVKVNGKETTFSKADNEEYLFDKNKLQFNQSSTATIDLKIPTVDKTKRWGVGAGYGSHGIAYNIKFPLGKKIDGWGYKDSKTNAVGVMISF